jgi:hypothetical protein
MAVEINSAMWAAGVVDALAGSGEIRDPLLNRGQRKPLKVHEAHHDIGDLNAGVVDVILDVDLMAGGAQETDKRIAKNGVAQVADVGRFIGIDAGVLDQCVQALGGWRHIEADRVGIDGGSAVEPGVDVSGAGDFEGSDAGDWTQGRDDLLGNFARSLAQTARQLEGQRRGVFAEGEVRRLLQHKGVDLDLIQTAERGAQARFELLLLIQVHAEPPMQVWKESILNERRDQGSEIRLKRRKEVADNIGEETRDCLVRSVCRKSFT